MILKSVKKFFISLILSKRALKGDFLEFLVSDGLPGYLLFPTVLSGLPTGYLIFVTRSRLQVSHVSRITGNVCENSSFEKITTIPIILIQLHYFADVMNEFELID